MNSSNSSKTILFIDDEETNIDVAVILLEHIGYKALTATNGKEALDIFKTKSDQIAVVIMDMIMPGLCGTELVDQIKEIDVNAKILLTSGYGITSKQLRFWSVAAVASHKNPSE